MAGKEQYTAEEMIKAITEARGMKTVAARALGCHYLTVQRYINNYVTVKQAWLDAQEATGDQVELTLYSQALGIRDREGNWVQPPNIAALIFLAKTRFKERGFIERLEIAGNLNLNIINETARALADAGHDPNEVFTKLMERAKQEYDANHR